MNEIDAWDQCPFDQGWQAEPLSSWAEWVDEIDEIPEWEAKRCSSQQS